MIRAQTRFSSQLLQRKRIVRLSFNQPKYAAYARGGRGCVARRVRPGSGGKRDMVEQRARSGDHDLGAASQLADLLREADAAVDGGRPALPGR